MISEHDLRQIMLLGSLDSSELKRLGERLRERRVAKGTFVVYADEPAPSMMFIRSGEMKISLLSGDGKEIVLAHLGSGDFFGEMALLTGEDRSANVVALEESLLYVLSAEDFREHILGNSGLSLALLKELALRLRAASVKIGDLALYDVYRRVARTLLSIAKPAEGYPLGMIEKRPTHQELAAMVGTSREMVTRALAELEDEKAIEIDGKRVLILKKVS